MSQLVSAPESSRTVKLFVRTNSFDAEIFLLDHTLQLVARATGVLETNQLPGVYKLKVHQAREIRERAILLTKDETINWEQPAVPSAAPLQESGATHEYQMAGAETTSRAVQVTHGTGGALFFLIRHWSAKDESKVVQSSEHPARGLRVEAWDGSWRLDLSELEVHDRTRDAWCSVNIALDPGSYVLRARVGQGAWLEQAISVVPGWQTQVFIVSRSVPDRSTGRQPLEQVSEVINASILMGRAGFNPSEWQLRMTETARAALADDRPVRSDELDMLLRYKAEDPMFGILGAHLLLLAREELVGQQREAARRERINASRSQFKRAQRPFDQDLFDTVIRNLRKLVGSDHPDVEALSMQCQDESLHTAGAVTVPPMLRRSWTELAAASLRRPELVPFELWSRVAMRASSAPFLSWLRYPDEPWAVERFMTGVRERLNYGDAPVLPQTGLEGVAFRAEVREVAGIDAEKVALDLEIPRSAVEHFSIRQY